MLFRYHDTSALSELVRRERLLRSCSSVLYFFFHDPATTEIYTLSLHDALPIFGSTLVTPTLVLGTAYKQVHTNGSKAGQFRSEEHTSELQSLRHLVCRLLLEKKKKRDRFLAQPDTVSESNIKLGSYRFLQHLKV